MLILTILRPSLPQKTGIFSQNSTQGFLNPDALYLALRLKIVVAKCLNNKALDQCSTEFLAPGDIIHNFSVKYSG